MRGKLFWVVIIFSLGFATYTFAGSHNILQPTKTVDNELKNSLSQSKCVSSYKYDDSAFILYLNLNLCKEKETLAILLTIRNTFEINKREFPKLIEAYTISGELLVSYPFKNIPTLKDLETSKDLEAKRAAGEEELTVFLGGDWETAYDAVMYVFRHSENSFISRLYKLSKIDNAKEDKVIYVPVSATGPVALGIFFEPLSDKKTKVSFVKTSFSGSAINQGVIYTIPEEVNYLLRHGKQSYLEYTHKLAEETAKKHQEELNAP
jgi:hypothetical protein